MSNQKYRDQVADLILKDKKNSDLVVTSDLKNQPDGSIFFQIGEDSFDGARYQVTIKIEKI